MEHDNLSGYISFIRTMLMSASQHVSWYIFSTFGKKLISRGHDLNNFPKIILINRKRLVYAVKYHVYDFMCVNSAIRGHKTVNVWTIQKSIVKKIGNTNFI